MRATPTIEMVGTGVAVFGARTPSLNVLSALGLGGAARSGVVGRAAGTAAAVSAGFAPVSGRMASAVAAESTHCFIPVSVTRAMLSCAACSR
jgi:hypothetical protein